MALFKAFDKLSKRDLEILKKGANLHIAVKNTLTNIAFTARTKAVKKTLPKKLIIRNQYTKSGVQYQRVPAGKLKIAQMQSAYGVDQKREYLAKQETGFKVDSGTIPSLKTRIGSTKQKRIKKHLYLDKLITHHPTGKIVSKLAALSNRKEAKLGSNTAVYIDEAARKIIKYLPGFYQFKTKRNPGKNFNVMHEVYKPHQQDSKSGHRKPVHWMQSNNSKIRQSDFDKSFKNQIARISQK